MVPIISTIRGSTSNSFRSLNTQPLCAKHTRITALASHRPRTFVFIGVFPSAFENRQSTFDIRHDRHQTHGNTRRTHEKHTKNTRNTPQNHGNTRKNTHFFFTAQRPDGGTRRPKFILILSKTPSPFAAPLTGYCTRLARAVFLAAIPCFVIWIAHLFYVSWRLPGKTRIDVRSLCSKLLAVL